jgi:hypothetical protein
LFLKWLKANIKFTHKKILLKNLNLQNLFSSNFDDKYWVILFSTKTQSTEAKLIALMNEFLKKLGLNHLVTKS